jgi:plasmid replication initiation protein
MSKRVVKDNALIEASYTLDVAEQRVILLAILEAREQKTLIEAGSLLRIHASSYIHQFNVDRSTAYKVLKEAVEGLYEAGFAYSKADNATGKIGHYKSRWVDKIGYIDDLGCVELVFASDVIPLITRLEKRFTEYDIEQISGLQSRYAIRLYELLSQWRSVGKTPLIALKDLRNKLGLLESEYNRADNFKRRVLDLAIKQINDLTDITADYEQHKQGRVITGFTFRFKYKTNEKKTTVNERDPNTIDAFTGQTDTESKNIPSWQLKGLSDAQIKKIGVYKQEFIDANTSKISPNERRGYDEIFESWQPMLKDPNQVKNFKIVQDLLERKRQN